MNIEKEIRRLLQINEVHKMKNPVILMNGADFEKLKEKAEAEVVGLKIDNNPMYANIPIHVRDYVSPGLVLIYNNPLKT